ncbi:hypothetical protein AKO1_013356 [Acrasis kona]|uniref:Uncharacterized protein n=1 Tax=Acrasis kona TaxID=1008807 RepID=A0AAW2YYI9_9EUKA
MTDKLEALSAYKRVSSQKSRPEPLTRLAKDLFKIETVLSMDYDKEKCGVLNDSCSLRSGKYYAFLFMDAVQVWDLETKQLFNKFSEGMKEGYSIAEVSYTWVAVHSSDCNYSASIYNYMTGDKVVTVNTGSEDTYSFLWFDKYVFISPPSQCYNMEIVQDEQTPVFNLEEEGKETVIQTQFCAGNIIKGLTYDEDTIFYDLEKEKHCDDDVVVEIIPPSVNRFKKSYNIIERNLIWMDHVYSDDRFGKHTVISAPYKFLDAKTEFQIYTLDGVQVTKVEKIKNFNLLSYDANTGHVYGRVDDNLVRMNLFDTKEFAKPVVYQSAFHDVRFKFANDSSVVEPSTKKIKLAQ